MFPPAWLTEHTNQKEMHALYHLFRHFCTQHPDALRRAQVLIGVDKSAVVGAFGRGRAKTRGSHALFVRHFELQVECAFLMYLK